MTVEFKKNNGTQSQVERPKSPTGTGPVEINRKPECEKKHIRRDGRKKK